MLPDNTQLEMLIKGGADALNLEALEQVWSSCCSDVSGLIYACNDKDYPTVIKGGHSFVMAEFLRVAFKMDVSTLVTREYRDAYFKQYGKEQLSALTHEVWNKLVDLIKVDRQITDFTQRADPFAESPIFHVYGDRAIFTFPLRTPYVDRDEVNIYCPIENVKQQIISDYLEHFPKLPELIAFIVACRFAPDRKATFLHMKLISDWGKTFLQSILTDLGIGSTTTAHEIDKALSGSPTGLSPRQLVHQSALVFDEATKFSGHMKRLGNEIKCRAIYELNTTVDIYAKIMMSAEDIHSLTKNGVDKQFANRISYWSFDNASPLTSRAVYNEHQGCYYKVIREYFCDLFIAEVERYKSLGRANASQEASRALTHHHEQYGYAKFFDTTEDLLPEFINGIKEQVYWWSQSIMSTTSTSVINPHIFSSLNQHARIVGVKQKNGMGWTEPEPAVLISDLDAVVATAVMYFYNGKETGLAYKIPNILRIMHAESNNKGESNAAETDDDAAKKRHWVHPWTKLANSSHTIQERKRLKGCLLTLHECNPSPSKPPDETDF
jgi:hypothetical protein